MAAVLTTVLLLVAAVAAWAGAVWVIFTVPPTRPMAPTALYVLLFTALTATASLVAWVVLRPRRAGRLWVRGAARYVGHAMIFSAIALFGLWLQSLRQLTGVVAILLAVLYLVLELALLFGTRGSVDMKVPVRPVDLDRLEMED